MTLGHYRAVNDDHNDWTVFKRALKGSKEKFYIITTQASQKDLIRYLAELEFAYRFE